MGKSTTANRKSGTKPSTESDQAQDEVEGPSPVQDKVPRCELGGLQPSTRSTRRCDGVVVRGGHRCLDARLERPAGWAAAVIGSRHRDRHNPATPLPSPAASGRRVPARPVRDDAPRPVRLEFVVRPPLGAGPSPGSGRPNGHCSVRHGPPCGRRRRSTACGPSTTRGCAPRCSRPGSRQVSVQDHGHSRTAVLATFSIRVVVGLRGLAEQTCGPGMSRPLLKLGGGSGEILRDVRL